MRSEKLQLVFNQLVSSISWCLHPEKRMMEQMIVNLLVPVVSEVLTRLFLPVSIINAHALAVSRT